MSSGRPWSAAIVALFAVTLASAAQAASDEPSATGSSSAPATSSGAQTSSEGVDVTTHGVVRVHPYQWASNDPVYMAVHGVQRTDTATVLYLSVGWPEGSQRPDLMPLGETPDGSSRFRGGDSLQSLRLAVPQSSVILTPTPVPGGFGGLDRAFTSAADARPADGGVMGVLYAVMPPLPDGVDSVDVVLGFGSIVPDVPVGDGLLEPTVEGPVVPLGTGWPEIPAEELASLNGPELSVLPLTSTTETIDDSLRESTSGEQVVIDIAADVLFAFDSAELSPQARQRVDEVAADIATRAAPDALTVVGHTDTDGTDAYNVDLSQRRAQAVADALGPALTGLGLDVTVEGRGESEPIADNATVEGREQNRRVAIGFTIDENGATS